MNEPQRRSCDADGRARAAPPSSSAPAAATAKPTDKPASDTKKKLPAKTAAKGDKVEGKKGGSGESKPAAGSHKASDKTVNASQRKKVDVDVCTSDLSLCCDDRGDCYAFQ